MSKFKISSILVVSFVLGISLFLIAAIANAEDPGRSNVNISEPRDGNINRDINSNENENDNENKNVNESQGQPENINGAAHRSAVANFVQNLLKVADKAKGGIGDQVRTIAQAQNSTKDQEAEAIDKINKRSKVTTFLVGSDYKTLGQLRSQMVTTQNQLKQLNSLLSKTTDSATKTELTAQITALTQELQKINDFIKVQDSKFSLFGWLAKLFSK